MADTTTTNFGFVLPEPGGSDDTWGDKLNANWSQADALLRGLAPVGTILMFDAATAGIPANWAICDGTNGTPNLTDRFIVGSSGNKPAGTTGGQSSITEVPAHSHAVGTLAADNGGAHTHTGSTDTEAAHTHSLSSVFNTRFSGGTGTGTQITANGAVGSNLTATQPATGAAGAHDHVVTIDSGGAHGHAISGDTASAGVASVDITPPYYAVVYIRRMT